MSSLRNSGGSTRDLRLEHLEQREVPAVLASFALAGAAFNDATRVVEGGLWQTAAQESNQPVGTVNRYVNDLTNVKDTLTAEKAANQFAGAALTHVNLVLTDLTTSVTNAAASATTLTAQTALRTAHLNILNTVAGDPALTTLAAGGFQQVAPMLPAGVTAANAPHANLTDLGAIFNDAANRIVGGVGSAANKASIVADLQVMRTGIQGLLNNFPDLFGGLTGIHADVIARQTPLELSKGINEVGVSPLAAKFSNDIFLDMIDIVQGDVNLLNMASQGATGFQVFPNALTAPTRYQDNDAQTAFLAGAIATGNTLSTQAINLATNDPFNTAAVNALITQFNHYLTNANNFVRSQGGIYEARFDNELLGQNSTAGAAVASMIVGLQNGDQFAVTAAAAQLTGNDADVAGNNIPVTGGTYNTAGTTVAQVLSTAH